MANFKVNNVPSWVRYTATDMQTEFAIPFPFINNSDLSVWQNGVLLVLTTDYTLAGEQTTSGGTLTLNVGASLNDMIVIQDLMVIDRTSIYTPTISALTGSQLNEDFNRDVIMIRDTTTTVNYLMLQYAPYALISQDIDVTVDRLIPILPPLSTWQKNADNTAIVAVSLPTTVVGVEGSFTDGNRLTSTNLIPGDNYIQQTDLQVIGDTLTSISSNLILTGTNDVRAVTNGNVILSPGGYVSIDGALWPTSGAAAGKSPVFINSTQMIFDFVANATELQNNTYIYADDTGTTNTFEIALNPPLASYVEGQTVYFKAANPNTGASTLNVNGLGALALYKNYNAQLANADILAGQIVQATYDGSTFQLDSPVANMTDGGGVNPGTIHQAAYYASSGNVVSGTDVLLINDVASSVNYIVATSAATGFGPAIVAMGSDTNIGMVLQSKGTGPCVLADEDYRPIVSAYPQSNPVNWISMANAATGDAPTIFATGSDSNINLALITKGDGGLYLFDGSNNSIATFLSVGSSAVNYIQHYNSLTTASPMINAQGTDTNIALQLNGKGTGGVEVQGSTDGNFQPAGYVGEMISSTILSASAVTCAASSVAKDLTFIDVTAGNWAINANIFFNGPGVSGNWIASSWASTTSATTPDNAFRSNGFGIGGFNNISNGSIPLFVKVTTTTRVYVSGMATYAGTTPTMCGGIYATRLP